DAGPGLENLASHVQSNDDGERHLDAGHAANRQDVVVIQGARLHTDHHMPVGHHRIGEVRDVLELVEPAMLRQHDRLHFRGPPEEMDGISGIAAPSWRGSDAPKWTPVGPLITACPHPNMPLLGSTIVSSWPCSLSCLQSFSVIIVLILTSNPTNVAL